MSSRCTSSPVGKKIFCIFTTSYFACPAQDSPLNQKESSCFDDQVCVMHFMSQISFSLISCMSQKSESLPRVDFILLCTSRLCLLFMYLCRKYSRKLPQSAVVIHLVTVFSNQMLYT